MPRAIALALLLSSALPANADTLLSQASGNWAGPSQQGFFFLARLSSHQDRARLQIWGGATDAVPSGKGQPDFDNADIALGAFATRQELEVVDTGDGSILQIVTEFADEEAEGRTVLQLQFIDNQYSVVGFYLGEVAHGHGGDPVPYECDLDFRRGIALLDGVELALPPIDTEALNASGWTFSTAFDRGYCARG